MSSIRNAFGPPRLRSDNQVLTLESLRNRALHDEMAKLNKVRGSAQAFDAEVGT